MADITFNCACGKAQLLATHVTPETGTRIVCYCKDCQAFAHFLSREDTVLDGWGGTEVFQMPMAYVQVTAGKDELRCMRLSKDGLYRWYTGCCNTPIGNTMGAGMPFISLIHSALQDVGARGARLGPVKGYVQVSSATSPRPGIGKQADLPFPLLLRIFFKLFKWKLKGLNKPSSFFTSEGRPVVTPFILNSHAEDIS